MIIELAILKPIHGTIGNYYAGVEIKPQEINPVKATIRTGMHAQHRIGKKEPHIELEGYVIGRKFLLEILGHMSDMENKENES